MINDIWTDRCLIQETRTSIGVSGLTTYGIGSIKEFMPCPIGLMLLNKIENEYGELEGTIREKG